ncbi:hypothetical protein [Pseudorhodoferax sp. Leaf274]|uniref:hypothetical protein n=1 Tax=Pseudorhodoferax sp. Leaf274 TaxID=1736318 RepID=UPI00070336CF|nr:hypothetical protein [Pseudorhodoferax sp. Leaf274]KQP43330.1 hypothetical protein ASF44_07150 [Pseudorhodoferax sp. Leaf274]
MELQQAQALALIEEHRPDDARLTLRNSGYGDLADQWMQASSEFETVARSRLEPAALDGMDAPVSTDVLRAYARMCMSWSRIVQLRDQAVGWMERRD